MSVGAAVELPSLPMTSSARFVGSSSSATSVGPLTICRAGRLDHRVGPHDEALVAVGLDLDLRLLALGRLVDHLVPGLGRLLSTLSLRYQSSCVFDQIGTV